LVRHRSELLVDGEIPAESLHQAPLPGCHCGPSVPPTQQLVARARFGVPDIDGDAAGPGESEAAQFSPGRHADPPGQHRLEIACVRNLTEGRESGEVRKGAAECRAPVIPVRGRRLDDDLDDGPPAQRDRVTRSVLYQLVDVLHAHAGDRSFEVEDQAVEVLVPAGTDADQQSLADAIGSLFDRARREARQRRFPGHIGHARRELLRSSRRRHLRVTGTPPTAQNRDGPQRLPRRGPAGTPGSAV
jgi:hypothetical protein